MTADPATLPAAVTLDEAVAAGFSRHLFTAFPVVDAAGSAVGVLSVDDVRAVPAARRSHRTAGEAAARDEDLIVPTGVMAADLLARPTFQRVGRAVVVDRARRPIGLVSITDLQRRLRADELVAVGRGPR
jgi:CBS domain-containing protein